MFHAHWEVLKWIFLCGVTPSANHTSVRMFFFLTFSASVEWCLFVVSSGKVCREMWCLVNTFWSEPAKCRAEQRVLFFFSNPTSFHNISMTCRVNWQLLGRVLDPAAWWPVRTSQTSAPCHGHTVLLNNIGSKGVQVHNVKYLLKNILSETFFSVENSCLTWKSKWKQQIKTNNGICFWRYWRDYAKEWSVANNGEQDCMLSIVCLVSLIKPHYFFFVFYHPQYLITQWDKCQRVCDMNAVAAELERIRKLRGEERRRRRIHFKFRGCKVTWRSWSETCRRGVHGHAADTRTPVWSNGRKACR